MLFRSDIGQLPTHQGLYGNGRVGLDVADHLDFHRDVAGSGFGHGDRDIAAPAAASAALPTAATTAGRV